MPTGAISTRTQAKFGRTTIWIPACVAVTAVALALVSHDPIADGPRRLFAIALVQLLAGSLVFGTVVFRSSLVDATKASFLSLLLVLGGVAIHVARLVQIGRAHV